MQTLTKSSLQTIPIKELLAEPAEPLATEDLEKAKAFANGLFIGQIGDQRTAKHRTLGEVYNLQTKAHIQVFWLEYFTNETASADAALLGLEADESFETWALQLRNYKTAAHLEGTERKAIAQRSRHWRRQQLANLLTQGPQFDDQFAPFNCVYVNYQPSVFLERLEGLIAYRQFYREVANNLREESDTLERAKRAILTIYQKRVDGLLKDEFALAVSLQNQLTRPELSSDEQDWLERLDSILSILTSLQKEIDEVAELRAIDTFLAKATSTHVLRPALDAVTLTQLDAVRWNPKQLKQFIEAMLAKWQLLSTHQAEWDAVDARSNAAPDGLFQVVIRPKSSLAVSSTKRVIFVPYDFDRTLTSLYPAGCLPVVAHELTHALQAIADDELGKIIPLATIKGHNYRPGREAGGVYQESIVQEHYFGRTRPLNLHYAHAMAAKLRGSSQLGVIRAFYDSYKKENSDIENAAFFAVDRALRLYRSDDYHTPAGTIEQANLLEQLHHVTAEQATQFALAGSSFSPTDALQLRHFGLLTFPYQLACKPAHDVVWLYTSEFLNRTDNNKIKSESNDEN